MFLDHFLWFYYFTQQWHEFSEITAFFVVMVWLIPFSYFISLSANESTLPWGMGGNSGNSELPAELIVVR